jgi:hypothetical protein
MRAVKSEKVGKVRCLLSRYLYLVDVVNKHLITKINLHYVFSQYLTEKPIRFN